MKLSAVDLNRVDPKITTTIWDKTWFAVKESMSDSIRGKVYRQIFMSWTNQTRNHFLDSFRHNPLDN